MSARTDLAYVRPAGDLCQVYRAQEVRTMRVQSLPLYVDMVTWMCEFRVGDWASASSVDEEGAQEGLELCNLCCLLDALHPTVMMWFFESAREYLE